MAETSDIQSNLSDSHWEKIKDYPNKEEFKDFRLTRHMEKGKDAFVYLAQTTEEDIEDEIFQLLLPHTKGDPFKGLQRVSLVVKDGKEITGISCIDDHVFLRK